MSCLALLQALSLGLYAAWQWLVFSVSALTVFQKLHFRFFALQVIVPLNGKDWGYLPAFASPNCYTQDAFLWTKYDRMSSDEL